MISVEIEQVVYKQVNKQRKEEKEKVGYENAEMNCEFFNPLNISLNLFYFHFNVVVRYIVKLWCS